MDECHCDRKIAELQEEVEDLRAALCMAEDEIAMHVEDMDDERASHAETVLDANYLQDVLDEIRTLCNIPWDVTNNALPDYLSARIIDFTPKDQEDEETVTLKCNSNTFTVPYDADTFTCSCCGATARTNYRCASCGCPAA